MTKQSLHADHDTMRIGASILDGDRVHRASEVGVAPVRREDRSSHDEIADGAGESRQPRRGAFPGHRAARKILGYTIDLDDRLQERSADAVNEVGVAREFHRSARAAMQHADAVDRTVGRVDARQSEPVIARELPGDRRKSALRHGALGREVVGLPTQ